jgi:hypothetical protein
MLLQAYHNFHIADEFKIVIDHKFHTHYIIGDFKFVLMEKYDNQNELNILLPFPPYFDNVEYGYI